MKIVAVLSQAVFSNNVILMQGFGLDQMMEASGARVAGQPGPGGPAPGAMGGQPGPGGPGATPGANPVQNLGLVATMGVGISILTASASLLAWLLHNELLRPFRAVYLELVIFSLIVLALVWLFGLITRRYKPRRYAVLAPHLPGLATNSVMLGTILQVLNGQAMQPLIGGIGAGIGWMVTSVLFTGLRERFENPRLPRAFRGLPITMLTIGLMALVFTGFSGIFQDIMNM